MAEIAFPADIFRLRDILHALAAFINSQMYIHDLRF